MHPVPVCGVDISKDHFDAAIARPTPDSPITDSVRHMQTEAGRKRLALWLRRHAPDAVVVLEDTGVYSLRLERALIDAGFAVFRVNPTILRNSRPSVGRTKSDPLDARLLADAGRIILLTKPALLDRFRVIPGDAFDNLALWNAERHRVAQRIVEQKNVLEAVALNTASDAATLADEIRKDLESLARRARQLKGCIERAAIAADKRAYELLLSINGIGVLAGAALLESIRSIKRFASPDALKAFLGWYPSVRGSGKVECVAHLAKHGPSLVRSLLWMAAKSAARHDPTLRAYYLKLVSRFGAQRKGASVYAWTGVARRLVQIVWGVLHSGKTYDPAKCAPRLTRVEIVA
ncbi:MAG: IS110 family transposase [Phycisphaerae bacterium]|nr:IS110 family transposase [Phycisphaerae bacterium]